MATANIDEIVEILSNMQVIDLAKLKTALETKWGVKAAAPVAVAAAPAAGGAAAAEAQEATSFNISLDEASADKRIAIIKVVREITGLGLKEAKDLVEGAPKPLKANASKAEAEEIVKKVQAAGGKASMKGV